MKLPQYLFWLEWVKKTILDPFWWVICFLIILWIPFLRVWWWVFLPLMLQIQLKTIYLWYIRWDFYIAKRKWVLLELIPPKEMLMPLKAMEDIFASLWPICDVANFRERWCEGELENGPEWCSWEIVSVEGKIHFYLRVGRHHRSSAEAAIYGHYPDMEITEVTDYTKLVPPTVPNEEWDAYGEEWQLNKNNAYPIKTYEKFFEPQGERISAEEKRIDPITSLLEGMSTLGTGEYYWVQFTSVPVPDHDAPNYRADGLKLIGKLAKRSEKKEATLMDDLMYLGRSLLIGPDKDGESYSWPAYTKDDETGDRELLLTPGEKEVISEIENKLKKSAWRTNIRGFYVAKRDAWSSSNRVILRTYMGHFASESLNSLGMIAKTKTKVHYFLRKRRTFLRARRMFRNAVLRYPPLFPNREDGCSLLSSEEMATLFHFPVRTSGILAPTLEKVESKKAGPPPNLPIEE